MSVRQEEKTEVPVSSLIDVVFLLIMFFVVTANIEKEAFDVQINLVKAKNMKPAAMIPPNRITINIDVDPVDENEGIIYVEATEVSVAGLKSALIDFKNRAGSAGVVMIRADRDVLFKHESDVIEAIKAAGLSNIRIQAELGD